MIEISHSKKKIKLLSQTKTCYNAKECSPTERICQIFKTLSDKFIELFLNQASHILKNWRKNKKTLGKKAEWICLTGIQVIKFAFITSVVQNNLVITENSGTQNTFNAFFFLFNSPH